MPANQRFDIRTNIILKDTKAGKISYTIINMTKMITRRALCTQFYREDEVDKNSIIIYEFVRNIRIIQKFRTEYCL